MVGSVAECERLTSTYLWWLKSLPRWVYVHCLTDANDGDGLMKVKLEQQASLFERTIV